MLKWFCFYFEVVISTQLVEKARTSEEDAVDIKELSRMKIQVSMLLEHVFLITLDNGELRRLYTAISP